jgi:hypothetical protein
MTWSKPKTIKNAKTKPPHWRIVQLLRKLRVKFKERNKGESSFHITVDDFGIVFKFNKRHQLSGFTGWDIFDVDMAVYEENPLEFGRNLMWVLIDKGYMAYLRDPENGNSKIFRHFLINEGWAEKILDRRLKEYNGEPRNKYKIDQITRLRKMPLHYVMMHYPSIFDYSW